MSTSLPPLDLQPVRFETQLGDLDTGVVVESEDGTITVVEVLDRGGVTCKVRLSHHTSVDPTYVRNVPVTRELGDFAVVLVKSRPVRAFALPAGRMEVRHRLGVGLAGSVTALACVMLLSLLLISSLAPALKAFLGSALVLLAGFGLFYRPRKVPASRHSFKTAAAMYPLENLLDDRPAAAAAVEAVAAIKEEYGRLLSDIVYRIENPALFDPMDAHAKRFTTSLIRWDTQQSRLDGAELGTLAAEIKVAFETARAHAEAIGLDHVPEESRAQVGRALKAARLAQDAGTPDERKAALSQTRQILAGLAIYYLPNPEEAQLMVEGHRVLALPGRRTAEVQDG